MKRKIQAVIFDVGSVLVREEDRTPREQIAFELGLTYDGLVEVVFGHPLNEAAAIGKITTAAFYNAVGESLNLSQAQITHLYDEFYAGNRMDYDLIDLVRSLRTQYKTAILSNALDELRSLLVHRWRVADAFDQIVISAEEGCAKPDPRIYQITLKKLAIAPAEAVFIDDNFGNIETASGLGMHGILFESAGQAKSDLKSLLSQYNSSYE